MSDGQMSFAEGFRVSLGLLLATGEGGKTTAISGRKCAELLPLLPLDGSLEKMCRALMTSNSWHSTECFLIWKPSATKGCRLKFRLVPSMRSTVAVDSGLWPTLHGMSPDGRSNGPSGNELGRAVNRSLVPTPRAADADKGIRTPEGAAKERARRKNGEDLPSHVGGSLNPTWVEWLMGFPEEWTALEPSEMPSSRKSSK